MARINFSRIKQQVAKQAGHKIIKASDKILDNRYKRSRQRFIEEIAMHPISQELEAGPLASNTSLTLGRKGNLFSFLGFEEESKPIEKLLEFLDQNISKGKSKLLKGRKTITVRSSVNYPSLSELEDSNISFITNDYPNRGWIHAVRKGQAGYGRYIYEIVRSLRTSRSGTGLQLKGTRNLGSFFPRSEYISKEITNFRKNLKK